MGRSHRSPSHPQFVMENRWKIPCRGGASPPLRAAVRWQHGRPVPATTACSVPHLDCDGWRVPKALHFWGARGSEDPPPARVRPSALLALSLSRQPLGLTFSPVSQRCDAIHPAISTRTSPPRCSAPNARHGPRCGYAALGGAPWLPHL